MRDSWGFLFRLCKVAYTFRLLLPVVPVQPFANEVANNICRNRNKKSDYKICHRTSPPFCWRFGSVYSISHFILIFYNFLLMKTMIDIKKEAVWNSIQLHDLSGNRTRVYAVRGRRLDRLTNRPYLILFNRGDVIRTRDLCVPNAALYQTEPRLDMIFSLLKRCSSATPIYYHAFKKNASVFLKKIEKVLKN